MLKTLKLLAYLENAALEVAEAMAVHLSYYNLPSIVRKVVN
jgi:hypothetical protein